MGTEKLVPDKSLTEQIFALGRAYDSQRDGPPRSMVTKQDRPGGLWTVEWTNCLPSDEHWDMWGIGHDEESAKRSLIRLLAASVTEDTGKHRVIRGMK